MNFRFVIVAVLIEDKDLCGLFFYGKFSTHSDTVFLQQLCEGGKSYIYLLKKEDGTEASKGQSFSFSRELKMI